MNPFISYNSHRSKGFSPILELLNKIYSTNKEFLVKVESALAIHDEAKKAKMLFSKVKNLNELREYVDELGGIVDDEL